MLCEGYRRVNSGPAELPPTLSVRNDRTVVFYPALA
jgi:hypothetical protein